VYKKYEEGSVQKLIRRSTSINPWNRWNSSESGLNIYSSGQLYTKGNPFSVAVVELPQVFSLAVRSAFSHVADCRLSLLED